MEPNLALQGVLLPAVLAGLVLLVGWRLHRRDGGAAPAWVVSLAVGAAAASGHVLRFGWQWAPRESWRWLGWIVCAAALLGMLETWPATRPSAWRWGARAAVTWAALRLVLGYKLERAWTGFEGQAVLAALCAAVLCAWWLWERGLGAFAARSGALFLWSTWTLGAVMLLFAYSARLAELGGAVCAGLGALVVAGFLRPRASLGAALPVVLIGFACMSVLAVLQGKPDFHPAWFLSIFFAPAAGAAMARAGHPRPWLGFGIGLAGALVAAAIAWRSYAPSGYGT